MRRDAYTFADLEIAVEEYRKTEQAEPLFLVFHTPGEVLYRYIVTRHGIARQDCDQRGEPRP